VIVDQKEGIAAEHPTKTLLTPNAQVFFKQPMRSNGKSYK
jgi:hypothetical protein